MVVKLFASVSSSDNLFESRVILDGSQTFLRIAKFPFLFESRVILDGSQTRTVVPHIFKVV